MHLLSRTLAVVAFVVAGVLSVGAMIALAQSASSVQRTVGTPARSASTPAPSATAPPLPLGDMTTQGAMRSSGSAAKLDPLAALGRLIQTGKTFPSKLVPINAKRPPIPKLTDLLHHKARFRQSATGGTIVLTGTSNTPYLDDQTLAYGSNVFWLCQNLTASTTYRYVLFPPDGTAYLVQPRDYVNGGNKATFTTDTSGRCMQTGGGGSQVPWYAQLSLQTPLAASPDPINQLFAGSTRAAGPPYDSPYSGVWTIAVQNTATNSYEAVAYSVVLGTLNFNTYSDSGFSVPSIDFSSGSTVYVSASGLNPAHFYSFGFVNTSGNGLPCVYSIPTGAQNFANSTCFTAGATGVLPTAQKFSGQYATPSSGGNSVGTQTVQLYDASTNDLISTQQISVNPSTVVWNSLLPYNGGTTGTNLNDTFATDGILGSPGGTGLNQEQSVQGLTYQASGVISGHVYRLTISNGNGVVMSATTTDGNPAFGSPQAFSLPAQFTATSTNTGAQKLAFPINTTNFTSFGATQTPFAPNVYTAQLYDVTAGSVIGSKSFHIVSYDANLLWTSPAGAYVNAAAAGLPTPVTTTITNDAGTLYGTWNADGIKQIVINNDSGAKVTMGLQAGITTATDSQGQTWNLVSTATTVTATPAVAGQFLAAGSNLPIPFTIAVATGNCTTACVLRPTILPVHGVVASTTNATMTNTATNGLNVYGNGVVGSNTQASYAWSIGAYSTATTLGTPRYAQMMYRQGTNGALSSGYYTATLTVTNNGAAAAMSAIEFTMPSTVDPNQRTPSIVSATINGTGQTANWTVHNQNGTNGATADGALGPNSFSLVSTAGAADIPVGKVGVFVIKIPILQTAFPFQQIPALANYTGTSYTVGATNTQTNAIAGTTNIDSTELAVFSLDPTLMYTNITPAVVPALANATFQFEFDNTSTGLDPNPDYVSQLLITVPSAGGVYPTITSVTASNGATFNANATGTAGQWLIDLCASSTAPSVAAQTSTPCSAAVDKNSLPPGGKLFVNFKYAAAPAVGNYTVNWVVVGANGGAVVQPTTGTPLVIANTTAQTSFTYAGGYTATPSYPPGSPIQPVTSGSQPVIGSWANYNNGNAFVFELYNNGSTTITNVSLAIPWANTSGQLFDTANPWNVIAGSIYVYGAGVGAGGSKCLGNSYLALTQAVNGSPGTSGLLTLSGCNVAVGQKLDIFFNAKEPYDIGSTFRFDSSVATGGATPPDPRTSGNANTLALYSLSNTVRVVTDARLSIVVPTAGVWPGGTFFGQSTLSTNSYSCGGCTFTNTTTPIINLNNISGTATINDTLGASVYSDDTNGWAMSVQADINPSTSSGQVSTFMLKPGHSSTPTTGALTYSLPAAAPGTVIPTASSLAVSSWNGGSSTYHFPIDNLMSYQVTVNPLSVNNNNTTTITLTYTLIAN